MKTRNIKIIIFSVFISILSIYFYLHRVTIDVIIPVYNSEKYLNECLDSVFLQSGNFRVIAVNDGSTDNSPKILETYAQKHKNMVLVNQKNKGVAAARNTALKYIKSKYVTFVDSDDWLEENAFSHTIPILKKDSPQILLVGKYDVYDEEWIRNTVGKEVLEKGERGAKFPSRNLDKLSLFSPFYGNEAHSDLFYTGTGVRGQFFSTNFIKDKNLHFPENVSCGEDDVFVYRAFLNNPLISICTEAIYNYRNRTDSITKNINILSTNGQALEYLQNTEEYKKAPRQIQMLLDDCWISWTIIGLSNLQRNGYPYGSGFAQAYKVYQKFSKYNSSELKACRQLKKLKLILFRSDTHNSI